MYIKTNDITDARWHEFLAGQSRSEMKEVKKASKNVRQIVASAREVRQRWLLLRCKLKLKQE